MARRSTRSQVFLLAATLSLLLGACFGVAADPPPKAPASQDPDSLLKALSKPDWRERRDAIQQLFSQDIDAEAAAQVLLRRDLDREQRKNVELALELIQNHKQFGATLVTLHLNQSGAAQAIAELAKQTKGELPSEPSDLWSHGSWPTVTIDVDRRPFWEVLNTLSTQLHISYINVESQELELIRSSSPRFADSVCTDGAFIFGASAYTTRRSMIVEIIACGEPKAPIVRTLDLTIDHGIDDQGNKLMSQSGRGGFGRRGGGLGGPGRWGGPTREGLRIVNLMFQHPQEGVLRIAELTGKITVSAQCGTTLWEINDPVNTEPVTRTIDAIPVTIHTLHASDDSYELRASIPYGWSDPRAPADEIIDLMRHGLKLLDEAGHALPMGVPDTQRGTATTDITVDFNRGVGRLRQGPPKQIAWTIPDVKHVVSPISFRNLPIDGGF